MSRARPRPLDPGAGVGGSDPPGIALTEDRTAGTFLVERFPKSPPAIDFVVRGRPVPQGNARAFVVGKRAILATGARTGPLADWRQAIATEARAAIGDAPALTGPVRVLIDFAFLRPASHYLPANGRRPEPLLRPGAPHLVTSKPDLDKLVRACLDAITSVLIRDDSQVASLAAVKAYEGLGLRAPGVRIRVESLEADHDCPAHRGPGSAAPAATRCTGGCVAPAQTRPSGRAPAATMSPS